MSLNYLLLAIFYILRAYQSIIIISILLSWIPSWANSKIGRIIRTVGGWYIDFFRGAIVFGGLDFTPIIGIMAYESIIFMIGF